MLWVSMGCLSKQWKNLSIFYDIQYYSVLTSRYLKSFDFDENVSVFETTIRSLGGLISSHMRLIDNQTIIQEYNKNQRLHKSKTWLWYSSFNRICLFKSSSTFSCWFGWPSLTCLPTQRTCLWLYSSSKGSIDFSKSFRNWMIYKIDCLLFLVGNSHSKSCRHWFIFARVRCLVCLDQWYQIPWHSSSLYDQAVWTTISLRPSRKTHQYQNANVDRGNSLYDCTSDLVESIMLWEK